MCTVLGKKGERKNNTSIYGMMECMGSDKYVYRRRNTVAGVGGYAVYDIPSWSNLQNG